MTHVLIDLSNNNPDPIDFVAVKAAGIEAVFHKATEGQSFVDGKYAERRAAAVAAGLLWAGYHFADFTDPALEAAHFLSVAGKDGRILDSETNTDTAWQNAFLVALNEPGDEELDYGSASTLPRVGIRSFLWPASYGRNYGFGDCWQDTDDASVPGVPGVVDQSLWIGSEADWQAFWNLDPPASSLPPLLLLARTDGLTMPLSGDDLNAWLQDHALALWGRPLNPTSEIPVWAAYYANRGAEQTVINFYDCLQTNPTACHTYPS